MTTMNISSPGSLKDFVDEQVDQRSHDTSSEFSHELIRKEQDRLQLRKLLLTGASFAPTNRLIAIISLACAGKSGTTKPIPSVG